MLKHGLCVALIMAALSLAGVAGAAAEGHWVARTSKHSTAVGYVVPGYTSNEFVGFWMMCTPGTVTAFVDLGIDGIKDGNTYEVEMIVDGERRRFPARAVFSEMQQYSVLEASLDRDGPIVTDLAAAKTVRISVQGRDFDFSTEKLSEGMRNFRAACSDR